MTTIYLSSTYEDLKKHRQAVFDALRQSGYRVIAMEDYVAKDDRPLETCLRDVDQADLYVGLFALRYGYVPPDEQGNPDGLSITELEFRRAEQAGQPTLIFLLDLTAPWPPVYLDSETGNNEQGAKIRALREYLGRERMASFFSAPFELASKVQSAVSQHMQDHPAQGPLSAAPPSLTWNVVKDGSPYPGLMHFTPKYAPVYFGREAEVREVLDRLGTPEGRFLIVSGASGTGKSSLVDAGVLPTLKKTGLQTGLPGGLTARAVRLVPSQGSNPFDALLRVLHVCAQQAGFNPFALGEGLAAGRRELPEALATLIDKGLDGAALLLFLDQMEELFTGACPPDVVERFIAGLHRSTQTTQLWVIATIRSDWLHHCYKHRELLSVLNGKGHYALGPVPPHMMDDMIVRPAECAGVQVPASLVCRLIEEAGSASGNLPLLAFALQRLFEQREDNVLSEAMYRKWGGEQLGGLGGAIAEHVADAERALATELGHDGLEQRLSELFPQLVRISVEGLPTRRRAPRADLPEGLQPIVDALVQARLLIAEHQGQNEGAASVVSVAHERLFEAWPALKRWTAEHQEELRLLRQGELDGVDWPKRGYDLAYLWHLDRLKRLQAVIKAQPQSEVSQDLRDFAWPQQRLVQRLQQPGLTHKQRDDIGDYLAVLGDPRPGVGVDVQGTPDIDWIAIPGGTVKLEDGAGETKVEPFQMARYPLTNAQFQAFVDAPDGYRDPDWWCKMSKDAANAVSEPRFSEPNRPRETVSWYGAVAFCHWLSKRLGFPVRLPTEFEWQQAATGGEPTKLYPWGMESDLPLCNSSESRLNRTTVVGLYPDGASKQGVRDLAGNVWEWCLNKHETPDVTNVDTSDQWRVVRGGSWLDPANHCGASYRGQKHDRLSELPRGASIGFRVARSPSAEQ